MSSKVYQSNRGFTIVELLIVIVVIAILAAISIVAYTGIQNNARASERQQDANNIVKVAETYFAEKGVYPTQTTDFAGAANAKLPANVKIGTSGTAPALGTTAPTITSTTGPTVDSGDGSKTYIVRSCGDTNGVMVYYWDPRSGETNPKTVRAGTGGCS